MGHYFLDTQYKTYVSALPIYKPLQEPTLSTSQKSSIEDIAPLEHQVNFVAYNNFSAFAFRDSKLRPYPPRPPPPSS